MKQQIWQCQQCGHKTYSAPGEQILAEFLCLEGRRKDGNGACLGLVRQLLGIARPTQASGGSDGVS